MLSYLKSGSHLNRYYRTGEISFIFCLCIAVKFIHQREINPSCFFSDFPDCTFQGRPTDAFHQHFSRLKSDILFPRGLNRVYQPTDNYLHIKGLLLKNSRHGQHILQWVKWVQDGGGGHSVYNSLGCTAAVCFLMSGKKFQECASKD